MEIQLILWFCAGLVMLVAGAELFVRGASRLALILGVSPLVIGLTIVAYGTSAPELAVTVQASLAGKGDVALGNVVGSNIAKILLILGLSALVYPLAVAQRLVRIEIPLVLAISILLYLFALDLKISRLEGGLFVALAVIYTGVAVWQSRKESKKIKEQYKEEFGEDKENIEKRNPSLPLGLVLLGLVFLAVGGEWLVSSATKMALAMGISELVAGLTIVAVGTSLPELATSIIAALKGERDIAIGNVIGSNLFNILFVLGAAGLISGKGLAVKASALSFDIPFMVAVTFAVFPMAFTGFKLSRWEGSLFVLYYGAYLAYLILETQAHRHLKGYTAIAFYYIGPLVLITLLLLALLPWMVKKRKEKRRGLAPRKTGLGESKELSGK